MNLSGIMLAVLIIVIGLGIAAAVTIVAMGGDRADHGRESLSSLQEDASSDPALPPPQNAWKPETWYSEIAEGTLFPNQPSPSFRISADSSLHRAVARREREALASNEPTRPHAAVSGSAPTTASASSERAGDAARLPLPSHDLDALTQTPTLSMRIAPVPDNLPRTLKRPVVRPARSTTAAFEKAIHARYSASWMPS